MGVEYSQSNKKLLENNSHNLQIVAILIGFRAVINASIIHYH